MSEVEYLDFVRDLPCVICGDTQVSPHHLIRIGMGRDRNKSLKAHYSAIPLCSNHHRNLHDIGEITFSDKHSINLWKRAHAVLLEFFTR